MQPRDPETWKAILEETHRGWLQRWLLWAAIYAAGFLLLWAVGLAGGWPFYAWAIGWALVKTGWDRRRYRKAVKRHTGPDGKGR